MPVEHVQGATLNVPQIATLERFEVCTLEAHFGQRQSTELIACVLVREGDIVNCHRRGARVKFWMLEPQAFGFRPVFAQECKFDLPFPPTQTRAFAFWQAIEGLEHPIRVAGDQLPFD